MLSSLNAVISTNERNWILTGHVIFKLRYNQIYQLKTTIACMSKYTFLYPAMATWKPVYVQRRKWSIPRIKRVIPSMSISQNKKNHPLMSKHSFSEELHNSYQFGRKPCKILWASKRYSWIRQKFLIIRNQLGRKVFH